MNRETILNEVKLNSNSLINYQEYNNDEEIVLAAIESDPSMLRYASRDLKQKRNVILTALSIDAKAYYYLPLETKKDKDLFLDLVRLNYDMLKVKNEFTREEMFSIYQNIVRTFPPDELKALRLTLTDKQKRMLYCASK